MTKYATNIGVKLFPGAGAERAVGLSDCKYRGFSDFGKNPFGKIHMSAGIPPSQCGVTNMSNRAEYDRLINLKWMTTDVPLPTDEQAMRGCRALYKKGMGRPWVGKVVIAKRKNQYTWIRRGVMTVNPRRKSGMHKPGWHDMVHLMSHYCHAMQRPHDRPHSDHQTMMETELTNYALSEQFRRKYMK